jgi:hypothetical protein
MFQRRARVRAGIPPSVDEEIIRKRYRRSTGPTARSDAHRKLTNMSEDRRSWRGVLPRKRLVEPAICPDWSWGGKWHGAGKTPPSSDNGAALLIFTP